MVKADFDQVYEEHKIKVWKLVSRYVFTREDREDLFQEIFLKVHRALPRFRGEAALDTWIYKIAVNTALNYLNRQNRFGWAKQMLGNLRMVEEEAPEPATDLEELKPLKKLNPQQRMVLLLAEVEEKKLEEIAEMMKIPIGTVKSTLYRAREILKKEARKNGGL
ncbi:sigma-70 family RNA polymerase sigma factor [Candidatus Saganbacteria bacterium]|nr:sigma-70 family RNA polymerase sigma factor [Candidatus Saganbacteria bacterium]